MPQTAFAKLADEKPIVVEMQTLRGLALATEKLAVITKIDVSARGPRHVPWISHSV
jgi:hypothetical protein